MKRYIIHLAAGIFREVHNPHISKFGMTTSYMYGGIVNVSDGDMLIPSKSVSGADYFLKNAGLISTPTGLDARKIQCLV